MTFSTRTLILAAAMLLIAASTSAQGACELACYGEQSQCAQEYCGWNYDWYWCTIGCDQILGQCLQDCEDFGGPPTCSQGIIDTWTEEEVVSEFNRTNFCASNSRIQQRADQQIEVEVWRRWQWADCTTSVQLVSRTFETRRCQRFIWPGFFCSPASAITFPACL